MNVATGLEFRRENLQDLRRRAGSYNDVDGVGVGGNAGSQGFPGFQPADVTDKKRNSWAAYLDIETDLSDAFKVQTAARHEHYSDFGSTTTAKLAASFRASETSCSAAHSAQASVRPRCNRCSSPRPLPTSSAADRSTWCWPQRQPHRQRSRYSEVEGRKSKNYTVGMTLAPAKDVSVTADLYKIAIDDRIVLSGRFDENNFPAPGSILQGLGVGQAQFFVNSVNTETKGSTSPYRTRLTSLAGSSQPTLR